MGENSQQNKIFWINFFQALAGFIILFLIAGYSFDADLDYRYDHPYLIGYVIVSALFILYSIGKIAQKYVRYEQMNEAAKKEKISIQEFNKKYKVVLDIYND